MKRIEGNMTIGKGKFIFERWRNYLGIVSLLLAIRMNILISPIAWYWYVVGFLASLIMLYLDMRFIVSDENATTMRKNPEIMEMKKMIQEIHERVK